MYLNHIKIVKLIKYFMYLYGFLSVFQGGKLFPFPSAFYNNIHQNHELMHGTTKCILLRCTSASVCIQFFCTPCLLWPSDTIQYNKAAAMAYFCHHCPHDAHSCPAWQAAHPQHLMLDLHPPHSPTPTSHLGAYPPPSMCRPPMLMCHPCRLMPHLSRPTHPARHVPRTHHCIPCACLSCLTRPTRCIPRFLSHVPHLSHPTTHMDM